MDVVSPIKHSGKVFWKPISKSEKRSTVKNWQDLAFLKFLLYHMEKLGVRN